MPFPTNPIHPALSLVLAASTLAASPASQADNYPTLLEDGHQLTLFADSEDIVTPIGIVIDERDRIFVVESHTHGPPKNYPGPDRDRIKMFVDEDNDGRPDSIEIFAEGLYQAMNLAFAPDGTLYALCAKELVALPDRDGDGRCDELQSILTLETKSGNAHGNWLGIEFDDTGKVYLSRGNVGSCYHRVEGKDGSVVEGYGDGGSVIRANADGTEVEPWATGFWNAFDLIFDRGGDLMLVDNDPDARGPNRLLEVVQGGDYGYKSLFGGGGNHAFQGWDGELPGTLPYLSGTGEAPSGLIEVEPVGADQDAAIASTRSYFVTIWNENTIERHTVQPDGSVRKTLFMQGDKDFRPVALDRDSRGNLFITDWVLVNYPNHGRGRIWRVTNMDLDSDGPPPAARPKPAADNVVTLLQHGDPFVRHRAEMWLAQPAQLPLSQDLAIHHDPRVRLGAFLALRRVEPSGRNAFIRAALSDRDPTIRRLALMWAAESLDLSLRAELDTSLQAGPVDAKIFEAYLAAVSMLNDDFIEPYLARAADRAYRIPRNLDTDWLADLTRDRSLPAAARALAVNRLEPNQAMAFLQSDDEAIRLAAIRKAAGSPSEKAAQQLAAIALDSSHSDELRAEAMLALATQPLEDPTAFIPLLDHPSPDLAIEATRLLRLHVPQPEVKSAFQSRYKKWIQDPAKRAQAELAEMALFGLDPSRPMAESRPTDLDTWIAETAHGGDPSRGSRVFRSPTNMCITCHSPDGSASLLGPSLQGVGQSMGRAQIVTSIIRPSDSFTPEYQAWIIYTKDGLAHQGLQIDHKYNGDIVLYTLEGRNRRFQTEDIENYETSPYSLMPPGLENIMTTSEFRDLIAYLSQTAHP